MICGNCGFQNQPGDEFCGSCGQFLAWTGAPADAGQAGTGDVAATAADASSSTVPAPPSSMPADAPTQVMPVPPPVPPIAPPVSPATPTSASGAYWPAGIVRCNVCGTANELTRTFCLNCGSKLPKAGTTGGLAAATGGTGRGPSGRTALYALGGALVFLAAAAIAFVALGGLNGPRPVANTSPTPGSSATLPAASGTIASSLAPTSTPVVTPGAVPSATTPAATPATTNPPPTVPPAAGFTCSASDFVAASPGGWTITSAHWSRRGPADSLSLVMAPSSSGSVADVKANLLPPDQVQATYGFAGPATGNIALVLSFNDAVKLAAPFGSSVGYKALQEFQVLRQGGLVYVEMGVNGAGCYSLASDSWASGSSAPTEFVVQIQR